MRVEKETAACRTVRILVLILVVLSTIAAGYVLAQESGKQYVAKNDPSTNRRQGLSMLEQIKGFLKEGYYDQKFGGIDIDKRFKATAEQVKGLEFNWQIYRAIAQLLVELNDSHTMFFPPNRRFRVEYGFTTMMIGANCFVTDVKKGSDAEAKGLKPGDQVLAIGQIPPTRDSFQQIAYILYVLDPLDQLDLRVKQIDGKVVDLRVASKFISPEQRKQENKKRKSDEQAKPFTCNSLSPDLIACKLRTFDVEEEKLDKMMAEAARGSKLILDLRGNGGGLRDALLHLIGSFFENDIPVGTEHSRGKSKERVAKGKKAKAYKGQVIVLIDSQSASASEVFARTMQLQQRGKVYGDVSAGAVMLAGFAPITVAVNESANSIHFRNPYHLAWLEVTVADFLMSDGGRLERVGVFPDKPIGSHPLALRKRSDPVLAYAAEVFGFQMTDEQAGALHFLTPKTEDELDSKGDGKDN